MDVVLQTHRLGKRFKDRWAVRELNLTAYRGDVFGFLGPNGAGKSTTIRMLLSLVNPTEGDIELFGRSVRSHRREVLARVGGLVERPDFYLYLTARRNLEIISALRLDSAGREIDDVMQIVGLADRAQDKVRTFSHGMKQRLGIAQALLGRPEFVILDEPTSGLDPQGIKEVRELIQRLSADHATTIFLSSHLLHEIEQTATRMAIIHQGMLVVQGSVEELLHAGDSVVKIEAEPLDKAGALVGQLPFVKGVRRDNRTLEVTMPLEKAAEANAALVQAGIRVNSLVPKRSLEDYFLTITEGASDRAPHAVSMRR